MYFLYGTCIRGVRMSRDIALRGHFKILITFYFYFLKFPSIWIFLLAETCFVSFNFVTSCYLSKGNTVLFII